MRGSAADYSGTNVLEGGRMSTNTKQMKKIWFGVGCVLLVVALIAFWFSFLTCIDESRKYLLTWLLSLVAGFAAGCFGGSIRVKQLNPIGISAVGGFAVFILSFWVLSRAKVSGCTSMDEEPWLSSIQYDAQFQSQRSHGYYPAAVAGRLHQDKEQFRAQWSSAQPTCWDSRTAMPKGLFKRSNKEMIEKGYRTQSVQYFTGLGGAEMYQVTWVKDTGPCVE